MSQQLITAAKEISERSHVPFEEVLRNLSACWESLTGHPAYTPVSHEATQSMKIESIEDFDL